MGHLDGIFSYAKITRHDNAFENEVCSKYFTYNTYCLCLYWFWSLLLEGFLVFFGFVVLFDLWFFLLIGWLVRWLVSVFWFFSGWLVLVFLTGQEFH